jgi:hypothetical protein
MYVLEHHQHVTCQAYFIHIRYLRVMNILTAKVDVPYMRPLLRKEKKVAIFSKTPPTILSYFQKSIDPTSLNKTAWMESYGLKKVVVHVLGP